MSAPNNDVPAGPWRVLILDAEAPAASWGSWISFDAILSLVSGNLPAGSSSRERRYEVRVVDSASQQLVATRTVRWRSAAEAVRERFVSRVRELEADGESEPDAQAVLEAAAREVGSGPIGGSRHGSGQRSMIDIGAERTA